MKAIELKTNIMCSACIEKVTPALNKAVGENNWKVDTVNPKKILTITTDALDENQAIEVVRSTGYQASLITK